jgi:hypothetical protein
MRFSAGGGGSPIILLTTIFEHLILEVLVAGFGELDCWNTMASPSVIQRSSIISQIPHPLDAQHGKTLTSDVHNLVNSRKRKRSEVAVAADGESVNIYDVWIPILQPKSFANIIPRSKQTTL